MNDRIADGECRPSVYVLTKDPELTTRLQPHLLERRMSLLAFDTPERLVRAMASSPDGLLLIDTDALSGSETLEILSSRVTACCSEPIPIACLASGTDIQLRLSSMRAGVTAYLETPIGADRLADRLADLIGAQGAVPDRVLVVDDQPVAALFAARVLESVGMLTERVADPLTVLDALDAFVPDLVLMDLHMPGATGIELTRIIREQDRFADLPIVFLSAELDAQQQMTALRVGGDDFLAKPVTPDQLVACVRQRLGRARARARRREAPDAIDPLTGLASLGRLLGRLDQLIGQGGADADRRALVCLELPDGDEDTLTRLAVGVAERTQASDLAARVGESTLAILMRRDDPSGLARACEILAEDLAEACPDSGLGVGWCGLAGGGGDAVTLLSRAGKAARIALESGDRRSVAYRRSLNPDGRADHASVIAAILSEELQLLFEPMVTLIQTPSPRYEVSPRLATADGELLSPIEFMPIARRSGLTERLDRWLLESGLDALMARQAGGKPVQLFIDQSFASVGRDDWVEQIRDEVNGRELFRRRPVLQFQVEEAVGDPDLASERVGRLARLGIRVCLTGLDTSDSSERVLERVPVTFVRLAREVVQTLDPEPLAELIDRIKARGLIVIAAGVEAPETIARLCRAGADLLQGPFVQPPSVAMDYDFSGADAMEAA
jgi:DNA-binding response OmpR family regulator/EAL domain-containing protein (putative c-di-GMP-specific phosphodiesterase class I)